MDCFQHIQCGRGGVEMWWFKGGAVMNQIVRYIGNKYILKVKLLNNNQKIKVFEADEGKVKLFSIFSP